MQKQGYGGDLKVALKLIVGNSVKEVECEELAQLLPNKGGFEVEGEPIDVERCWRNVLWMIRGKRYVLSYEVKPGHLKGEVIERKRPPRRRETPSKAPRRRSGKPSRGRRPSKRRGGRRR